MSITDWRSGSLGIPTFHCMRCLQHWLKIGSIPEACSEEEMVIEGPAMCIAPQNGDTSANILVGGALGQDGKPIKIKVEDPRVLRQLLREETRRNGRAKNSKDSQQKGDPADESQIQGISSDINCEEELNPDGSSENLLDLPDIVKKHILRHDKPKSKSNTHQLTEGNTEASASDYEMLQNFDSSSSFSTDFSSDSDGSFIFRERESVVNQTRQHANTFSSKNKQPRRKPASSSSYALRSNSGSGSLTVSMSAMSLHQHQSKSKVKSISHMASQVPTLKSTTSTTSSSSIQESSSHHINLQEISNYSFQSKSSHSVKSEHHTTRLSSSMSTSQVQTKHQSSSHGKQKKNLRGKSGKQKRKKSGIHLPSIVDSTSPLSTVEGARHQQDHSSPSDYSERKASRRMSDGSTHLPTLNLQTNNLVEQNTAKNWSTTPAAIGYSEEQLNTESYGQHTTGQHTTEDGTDYSHTEAVHQESRKDSLLPSGSGLNDKTRQTNLSATDSGSKDSAAAHSSMTSNKTSTNPEIERSARGSNSNKPSRAVPTQKKAAKIASAVVKQEFDPKQTSAQNIKAQRSRMGNEMQQIPMSASNHIPSFDQQNRRSSQTNIQSPPSFHDNVPRRYGQKIIKKSRKVDSESKSSSNYNSRDMNKLTGIDAGVDSNRRGSSSRASRRDSITQIDRNESSRQSLAARILKRAQQHQEYANVPMPLLGRNNSPKQFSRPSSTGLGPRSGNTMVPSKLENIPLEDGTVHSSTPQALVRLKPLEQESAPSADDTDPEEVAAAADSQDVDSELQKLLALADPNYTTETQEGDEFEENDEDSGLEDISEESEEEEDDGLDFEIPKPVQPLKDITPMSFTSAFGFSFYKMSGPYKQAYDKTHTKALEPLRRGRRKRKPPKVRRKKIK